MELVSMELSNSDAQNLYAQPSVSEEQPKYPYGLKIDLDQEALKKLGILELPKVGSSMKLTAEVEVCSASSYESKDGKADQRISLQIEAMALEGMNEDPSDKEDPSQTLYGSEG